MTLRNKIIFIVIGCMIVFIGSLVIFKEIQTRQNRLIARSITEQEELIVNNALHSKSEQLHQIVADYTNWDDLIHNLDDYDKEWAENNIASIIKSFKIHSVGVFNKNKALVYGFGKFPLEMLGNTLTRKEVFQKLNEQKFLHYYSRVPEGILEVVAATVHPTSDSTRITPGAGYFFASKIWDKQMLAELSATIGCKITIMNPEQGDYEGDPGKSNITTVILKDHNQQAISSLIFERPNKMLASHRKFSDFVMFFLSFLLLSVMGIFFFILFHWVRRPLRIISDTLLRGDTYMLGKLQSKEDEFSQIANMIVKFNQQRKELELENAERKLAQKEISKQSGLLEGLAEASAKLITIENLDDSIKKAFDSIAEKALIDRVFIFRNIYNDEEEQIRIKPLFEWMKPELTAKVDIADYQYLSYDGGENSLFPLLQKGRTVKGQTREFPEKLKTLFERQLVKSVIIVPVLDPIDQTFWGFAGFADCTDGHVWTDSEETVLGMLAHNVGGAIRRYMSQQELKEAMELARAADRAKSNFLASMSHEIRTPMNGVIGMTSLLMQTNLSDAQREYVETIETSGDSLLNIINEILDFSKIESGHMALEENSFDLRGCIEDVIDLLAPKIFEKRLEIIYYVDPGINSHIFGDGFRLRQILVNLIGNAIKFTEVGEIFVQVGINNQEEESVLLEFSVKDTGIGIPADKIESLFKPFTQVDASTTRKYGGSGLGLAISANLVKLMEGEIRVESEPGKGSDFRFTIKTYFTTAPPEINDAVDKLKAIGEKRILIVDDNATNRRILQLQCSNWNIGSVAVGSGAEVLQLLNKGEKFDAAILDMQMPLMDGEMLAKEIRKKYSKPELPLIMLTSIGFNLRSSEVQQLFSYYINKPVKHSHLAEILLNVLSAGTSNVALNTSHESDLKIISTQYPFKILIAEDNFINQKLVRNLFEVLGYKTDLVANGFEAIDALKRKHYDIIFMDVQMPEMDGYEATHKIRERWSKETPVIIAMTANAMQGDREKCFQAGMDDYISKPLRLEDIERVLRYWGELKHPRFLELTIAS